MNARADALKIARAGALSATIARMRLERTTYSATLLLSCSLLALGACGDDGPTGTGSGSTTEGNGTETGTPMTTEQETVDTTAAPDPGTTTTGEPTAGLDTTAGEEESSSSGGSSEDTSTGDPPVDCAGMSFATLTSVDNDMTTNLDVASFFVNCNLDIMLGVTGGTICVVDDGAGDYFYTVETLALEDVPPVDCGGAMVGLTNLSIVNTGDGTEVVVPQDGGTMAGNQSIDVLGDVEGTALGMDIATTLMDFSGVLPEGEVEFAAGNTTVTYADDATVIATAMPELMGITITVTLTGLTGSLTFAE